MTALTTFRLIAPEFSGENDATVNQFIALAPSFINVNLYSDSLDLAIALKAASLMLARKKSASGQSSGGELLMEKEGDLQRSYSAGSSSSILGSKNQYELMLDRLSLSIGFGGVTRYGISGTVR